MIKRRNLFKLIAQAAIIAAASKFIPSSVEPVKYTGYRSRVTVMLNGEVIGVSENPITDLSTPGQLDFQLQEPICMEGSAQGKCEILHENEIVCVHFSEPRHVVNGDTMIITHSVFIE